MWMPIRDLTQSEIDLARLSLGILDRLGDRFSIDCDRDLCTGKAPVD